MLLPLGKVAVSRVVLTAFVSADNCLSQWVDRSLVWSVRTFVRSLAFILILKFCWPASETPDASPTVSGSSTASCPSVRISEPCASDCASSVDFVPALSCCIVKVLGNFEDSFLFFPFENGPEILLQTCLGAEANFSLLRVSSVKNV